MDFKLSGRSNWERLRDEGRGKRGYIVDSS